MKIRTKIPISIILIMLLLPGKLFYQNISIDGFVYAAENNKDVVESENISVSNFAGNDDTYKGIVVAKANEVGIDWRLILAIMKQESQFNNEAVSPRGAEGLMQIMPTTQVELMDKFDLGFQPDANIQMGITYFSWLYKIFEPAKTEIDRISLSLAAYNAGPNRIYDAQDIAAYLGENPYSWRVIQNALPLLSKRYYTLHKSIWGGGKPRNGYFGSWRQTVSYVDKVVDYHQKIR